MDFLQRNSRGSERFLEPANNEKCVFANAKSIEVTLPRIQAHCERTWQRRRKRDSDDDGVHSENKKMGWKIISGCSATHPHYKPRSGGYQKKKPEIPALMDKNKLSAGMTKGKEREHNRGYELQFEVNVLLVRRRCPPPGQTDSRYSTHGAE